MNHKRLFGSLCLGLLLTLGSTFATPLEAAEESPLAKYIDKSDINPAYRAWVESGMQGPAPSAQDFSYLAESYSRLYDNGLVQNRGSLPLRYDLREEGRVDPVTSQGDLGICWAIAANSVASASLNDQYPTLALSAMHTAWFSYHGAEEEEASPFSSPYLAGGNDGRAVGTMAAWKGPVLEERAPYDSTLRPNLDESLRYTADYHLQDAYYMPFGLYFDPQGFVQVPEEITKTLIMEEGPLTINYYSHGTSSYNAETHAVYNSTAHLTDHAVIVCGWDDNYPKENFTKGNQPENNGAWLCRNSWGTDWGEDGYFWLSYEDKTITSGNVYRLEAADNYTTNYQYDTIGWSFSLMTDSTNPTCATAANIFTAEGDEQLEAVSFYTTEAGADYEISIYTNVSADNPTSGKCALKSQKGSEAYAGYHTIELAEPVALEKGERFSIIVTFKNPSYEMPLAIEWCPMASGDDVPVYLGSGGESYVRTQDGWEDIAGPSPRGYYITNACIKGFTNPLPESGKAVPEVQFSLLDGSVTDGSALTLTANGADAIYWDDGSGEKRYTGAITLDGLDDSGAEITIRAYAVADGAKGTVTSRTFTRAEAAFTDLAIESAGEIQHLDINKDTQTITLPEGATDFRIMAQSPDNIKLNGNVLSSARWSDAESLADGERLMVLEASAPGKTDHEITITVLAATGGLPGSDDSPLYPIGMSTAPVNGQISVSPSHAAVGTDVVITTTPNVGYTLQNLEVKTSQSNLLELRNLGDGRYSFTMPDGAVDISARFAPATGLPFTDCLKDDWFIVPVRYVYENGLMVGVSDTEFAPNTAVTRAMIWAVLAREAGSTEKGDGSSWYSAPQAWAIKAGVSDGLRPNDAVSRQELITMLHRAEGMPESTADLSGYTDITEIAEWAKAAMCWGVETELIKGLTDTTLAPQEGATRAQLATILMRMDTLES